MEFEDADMCKEEMDSRILENETVYFKSNFNFIKNINGFRPGELHMVLAASGAGKSTLMRSLLVDIQQNESSVMLWLTEESADQFKTAASYSRTRLKNVKVFSEVDGGFPRNNLIQIKESIELYNPDFFILDNLTASISYELLGPKQQTEYILELKSMCHEAGIPFLVFAHTNVSESELRLREIGLNDIRGGKGVAMLFEFFYAMQSFQVEAGVCQETGDKKIKRLNKLCLLKNRTQIPDSKNFILKFDNEKRVYNTDMPLHVAEMKKLWKDRFL